MSVGGGDSARADSMRMTASQIFAVAAQTGEDELKRSSTGLGISGIAAGVEMGLTGLGPAVVVASIGSDTGVAHLWASLLYPLGFIVVIVGRAQLFTENTLFPVVLVLDRHRHVGNTLRLWAVVLVANVVGALLFAVLVIKTPALSVATRDALVSLGVHSTGGSFGRLFWSGVVGGWIIALMAWLISAARSTLGQIVLVYLMTFVVGAAGLAHCIAGSGEGWASVLVGQVPLSRYLFWLGSATAGNIVGGVLMVSLLNYGQVVGSGKDVGNAERSLDEIEHDG